MTIITLTITYCLVLNGYICRTLEAVPTDHAIVSIPECNKGGAMGDIMLFTLDHAQWRTKGARCVESKTPMQTWLDNQAKRGIPNE